MTPRNRSQGAEPPAPAHRAALSWFPPHMHRAQKRLLEEARTADLVLEMRDARLPRLSANPDLARLVGNRQRLILFNKSSLADPAISRAWRSHLDEQGEPALFVDADAGKGLPQLLTKARELLRPRAEALRRRGIRPPPPRLIVMGIPNVGKSTLINRLIGRKRQEVGPRPGVTRSSTWVPLRGRLTLLDSPGVLLPRIESETDALLLSWIAAIPDKLLGPERVALALVEFLLTDHPRPFRAHYALAPESAPDAASCLDAIARSRSLLRRDNAPDIRRAAETVLNDFRRGALGRVTFEKPDE